MIIGMEKSCKIMFSRELCVMLQFLTPDFAPPPFSPISLLLSLSLALFYLSLSFVFGSMHFSLEYGF